MAINDMIVRDSRPGTRAAVWEIREFRGRAGLERLEEDWRRIWAALPLRTSFMSFEACAAHVDHIMADPDRLRCLALGDGREVRGICLLEPRMDVRLGMPVPAWGVLWLKHSHQAEVLCADDEARRHFLPALAAHVRREPEGRPLLVLGPLPSGSPFWEGLRRVGPSCQDPKESVRFMDCASPYGDLLAGLSGNFRRNLNTARKRLAALANVHFVTAREPQELEREFSTFLEVEASSWKGPAGTAVKYRGNLPTFFATLAGTLRGESDRFEIHALYAEGRCLASILGTRTGAVFSALKTAYDPAFARVSSGQVLLARVIELCCADPEIQRLDLVSDAPWLRGWRTEQVTLQLAYVGTGGWRGRLLTALLQLRFGPVRRLARWLRERKALSRIQL